MTLSIDLMYCEGFPGTRRAPIPTVVGEVSANSNMAAAVNSRSRSSKSTDIDVPGPTDTDMSVASIPEVEMADE